MLKVEENIKHFEMFSSYQAKEELCVTFYVNYLVVKLRNIVVYRHSQDHTTLFTLIVKVILICSTDNTDR